MQIRERASRHGDGEDSKEARRKWRDAAARNPISRICDRAIERDKEISRCVFLFRLADYGEYGSSLRFWRGVCWREEGAGLFMAVKVANNEDLNGDDSISRRLVNVLRLGNESHSCFVTLERNIV